MSFGSQTRQPAVGDGPLKTGSDTYSSGISDAKNYMGWIVDTFSPYLRGNIVEVGIGHGYYCSMLGRYGRYVGVDHDATSVAQAAKSFPDHEFRTCDILDRSQVKALFPEGADAIVSINVLEHIEEDGRAVANLVDALKPGGHLLLSVPALMLLYNDMDRLAGHYRRYTVPALRKLLDGTPTEITKLCYFNPIGGLGWWANSLKKYESLDEDGINGQIRLFDRYVVPISRALDPLSRSFFGQSVTCIAQRK
jgi:SAM-dependent methyltransferase